MADQLLQSEQAIITNYFNSGFTYDEILRFLSEFHAINMSERGLRVGLRKNLGFETTKPYLEQCV